MVDINFWAVLVAAFANMIIGALWYSVLFGKPWMRWMGATKEQMSAQAKSGAVWAYAGGFLIALVEAYALSYFVDYAYARSVSAGLLLGFLVWLGFIVTSNFNAVLYEGKSKKVYGLYVAYQLVAFLVMGVILALWQ